MPKYNVEQRLFADGSSEVVFSERVLGKDADGQKESLYCSEQKKQNQKDKDSLILKDSLSKTAKGESYKKQRSEYESLRRARQNVSFLARCNKWDVFATLTISPAALGLPSDANPSYEQAKDLLKKEMHYLKKRYPDVEYLTVMEQGAKNGRWHAHALIQSKMILADMVPSGHKDKKHHMIYNIPAYRIGFTTAQPVRSLSAVTRYISKYIGKSLGDIPAGKHRYWSSQGLNTIQDCRVRYLFDDKDDKEALFKQLMQTCDSYYKAVVDVIDGVFHYFRFNAPALPAGASVAYSTVAT